MSKSKNPEGGLVRGETTAEGFDKVSRYKWRHLDSKGEFMLLKKEDLFIDLAYQRDKLNEGRINDIASTWTWVLCGIIMVAIRNDKWFVMDGQHRVLAARKRSDISTLPCMVFDIDSQAAEAAAFVALNSIKTAVGGIDRFKAAIVSGDQNARDLELVIESTGNKISNDNHPKSVACIQILLRLFSRDKDVFKSLWPVMAEITDVGGRLVDCLVKALWGCEAKARQRGLSLTKDPLRSTLKGAGASLLTGVIRNEARLHHHGGERIVTLALAVWLDKQKLGSKFRLSE